MEVLVCLAERHGKVIGKQDLISTVWSDAFVTDDVLIRAISELRRVLDDDPRQPQFIETIPKRGYRLVSPVQPVEDSGAMGNGHTGSDDAVAARSIETATRTLPAGRSAYLAVAGLTVVAAAVLAGSILYVRKKSVEPIHSLAVLPFDDGATDSDDDYIYDGMTESLINSLSQIPSLTVKSHHSVAHYKGRDVDAQTLGRELNVDAVLLGRVTKRGSDVLLSVELVDARTNNHLWGEHFTRPLAEITALQADIAEGISSQLRLDLTRRDRERLARHYTGNPQAYQAYLRGRYFWNKRTEADFRKGIGYFQRAIQLDPDCAPAYAGLADSYMLLADYEFLPLAEALPLAKDAALKALALDDSLAEPHASLGLIRQLADHDYNGAIVELRKAIALNPNYAPAHHWLAINLVESGRLEEARAESQRAVELDPYATAVNRWAGEILYYLRRYDEAEELARAARDLDPASSEAHYLLGAIYDAKKLPEQAVEEYLIAWRLMTHDTVKATALERAYAASGSDGFWRQVLALEKSSPRKGHVGPWLRTWVYAKLGDSENVIAQARILARDFPEKLIMLRLDPAYDSLRSNPRFQAVVGGRMGGT